ncbi:ATP-binding cassette domain-containing protein [Paenalcaligenes niemegkensis]|uniref:ABC transporter ATP-binding protein n=1 Tax=Paenalcaligenes niemegkensis TaxID=2895469 RepID=UPI001EE8C58E|nr:ATP-binding cassette domain-containing protein [Paenalcaligenes niemegkensis]MCQ9616687.1 ATP-binding cassette domain-containing protein [Paenalcaligenes niemegkensis]
MSTTLLQLHEISQRFGKLHVLDQLTLSVHAGETLGLIGPNGAGKTSLLNIASGFSKPYAGKVLFKNQDITRLDPAQRARLGLMRSFQSSQIFPQHTIQHNLALALRACTSKAYTWLGRPGPLRDSLEQADDIVASSLFGGRNDVVAGTLSYGEQRLLDLLISVAQHPQMLLLDEPTAGLSKQEAADAMALLAGLHHQSTVVLVSHDLDLVFEHCDRIAVLNLGRLTAVDTPEAIRRHEGAQTAYLGGAE